LSAATRFSVASCWLLTTVVPRPTAPRRKEVETIVRYCGQGLSSRVGHGRGDDRRIRTDFAQWRLGLAGVERRDYDPAMATPIRTGSEWLRANPPDDARLDATLAGVAHRMRGGEDFRYAVREFLDQFALRADEGSREAAILKRPEETGDMRYDAYLGALAEYLAAVHGLERPDWAAEPGRFLETFWFVSDVRGFRATAIAQAPAAFRRRGVFIPERSLHRT
jgi:hypothetical protein